MSKLISLMSKEEFKAAFLEMLEEDETFRNQVTAIVKPASDLAGGLIQSVTSDGIILNNVITDWEMRFQDTYEKKDAFLRILSSENRVKMNIAELNVEKLYLGGKPFFDKPTTSSCPSCPSYPNCPNCTRDWT